MLISEQQVETKIKIPIGFTFSNPKDSIEHMPSSTCQPNSTTKIRTKKISPEHLFIAIQSIIIIQMVDQENHLFFDRDHHHNSLSSEFQPVEMKDRS